MSNPATEQNWTVGRAITVMFLAVLLAVLLAPRPLKAGGDAYPHSDGRVHRPTAQSTPGPLARLAQRLAHDRVPSAPESPASPQANIGRHADPLGHNVARSSSAPAMASAVSDTRHAPPNTSPGAGAGAGVIPGVIPGSSTHPSQPGLSNGSAAAAVNPEDRPLGHTSASSPSSAGHPPAALATPSATGPSWVLNTLTALGLVIGLIFLLRAGFLRFGGTVTGSTTDPVVRVLTRVSVAPRQHILLIHVGKRVLVVGNGPSGLKALADIDDAEEIAGLFTTISATKPNSISRGFTQMLRQFNGEYRDEQRAAHEGVDTDEHLIDRTRDQLRGLLSKVRTLTGRDRGVG